MSSKIITSAVPIYEKKMELIRSNYFIERRTEVRVILICLGIFLCIINETFPASQFSIDPPDSKGGAHLTHLHQKITKTTDCR